MKKITDSFIRRIVKQSLNENYRLLNEDDVTYSYTLPNNYGKAPNDLPAGTVITNLTIPECPDGGFCYSFIANAKTLRDDNSNMDLILKGCGKNVKMGKPTLPSNKISEIGSLLMNELSESFINYDTVKEQIQKLNDWPTFCTAYNNSKRTPNRPLGFVGTSEGNDDYGIENDDEGDRNDYYSFIASLFDNSIQITEENVQSWKDEIAKNAKILIDKKIEETKKAEQAKKEEEERKQKLTGGGSWDDQKWITDHPALGKNETITTTEGDASVYSLNTGNPNIDKYLYGILVRKDNGTIQHVKFLKTDKSQAYPIDGLADVWVKYGISQNDTWKYDDVILSDDGKNIALTTNPELENPFIQSESYRHRGFRYNLLTEIELKYDKNKPQKGVEVANIQSKLGLPKEKDPTFGPITLAKVIEFQKNEGAKLTPPLRTDGVVDDATYNAIMTIPPPAFELSIAKKSKGDDVKLVQQKLGLKDDGGFGTDTETAVKAFQEKYKDKLPNSTPGVVDQATFNLIKTFDSRKIYSGGKAPYKEGDWIYVNPKKGLEGDLLAEKKYFKILSISPDRYTIVLDLGDPKTVDYKIDNVGGVTAKVLFGRDAEGATKDLPVNTSDDASSGSESSGSERGKRNVVGNRQSNGGSRSSGGTVDSETQRKRKLRTQETCNTLRQIKQYLNNMKGLSMTVNCKWNQEIRNQVMMALTGESPAPAPSQDSGVNTQPIPVTDKLF